MTIRVLIVEDEFLIAFDLKAQLEAAGFTVYRPASSVKDAFAELDRSEVDVAILDLNLHGRSSIPVAERLTTEQIPFLFLSGNDVSHLPPAFADRKVHTKPVTVRALVCELTELHGG